MKDYSANIYSVAEMKPEEFRNHWVVLKGSKTIGVYSYRDTNGGCWVDEELNQYPVSNEDIWFSLPYLEDMMA